MIQASRKNWQLIMQDGVFKEEYALLLNKAQDQRTSQNWLERWTTGAATSASPAAHTWAIGAGGLRWSTPAHDQRRSTGRFAPVSGAGRPALVDQRTAYIFVPTSNHARGTKVN
ncbi:hypothetical protein Q3G72_006847 [Acer saccharum]|nr:hypothetical protein Q3G72_006847 [Acer saccharum]